MKSLVQEFRNFLFKGDLIAVAVAFIIATAFAALVKAFIADLITPIIALIFGQPDFGTLSFTIHSSHFFYGDFINALVTFVSVGAAVFFFVAKPYEAFQALRATDAAPSVKACPECTTEIPAAAKRCPQCTAVL
jgi:large conductance mechanosensitive channel